MSARPKVALQTNVTVLDTRPVCHKAVTLVWFDNGIEGAVGCRHGFHFIRDHGAET